MNIERNYELNNLVNEIKLKITESGYAKIDSDWNGVCIAPSYSRLYYIADGNGEVEFCNEKIILSKGYVYLFPLGNTIKYKSYGKMHKLYFHIKLLNSSGYDLMNNCKSCLKLPVSDIYSLVKLYNSNDISDAIAMQKTLLDACMAFLKMSNDCIVNTTYSPLVRNLIQYINDNLTIKLSVKDLSEKFYVSRNTISNCFKKEVGITLGQYIDRAVMSQAEFLLKNQTPIDVISDTLGFCDQFYFSRKFNNMYMESPSKYQKRWSSGRTD